MVILVNWAEDTATRGQSSGRSPLHLRVVPYALAWRQPCTLEVPESSLGIASRMLQQGRQLPLVRNGHEFIGPVAPRHVHRVFMQEWQNGQ